MLFSLMPICSLEFSVICDCLQSQVLTVDGSFFFFLRVHPTQKLYLVQVFIRGVKDAPEENRAT